MVGRSPPVCRVLGSGAGELRVLVLLLGLQLSSLMMSVFQALIPLSAALLLVTLKLVLDRTDVTLLAPKSARATPSWNPREPSACDASSLK